MKKYNIKAPYPEFYCPNKATLRQKLICTSFIERYKESHYRISEKFSIRTKKDGSKRVMACDDGTITKLLTDYKKFPKSKRLHDILSPLLGNSIFTTNGDVWKFQRDIMNKSFASLQPRKTFSLMSQATEDLLRLINTRLTRSSKLSIDSLMTYIAANIIFKTIFSINYDYKSALKLYADFSKYQVCSFILETKAKYLLYPILKYKQKSYIRKIHNQFQPEIKKRFKNKAKDSYQDILAGLINSTDDSNDSSFNLKDLNEQVCMLFLAGHETSATALTWALFLISQSKELQDDLYIEINKSLNEGEISYDSIKNMPLLSAIFEETLRLYPPVIALPRECHASNSFEDINLDANDEIIIPLWLQHRHHDKWENPMEFDPYRFFNKKLNQVCPAYMPFGKGDRVCVGSAFARQEGLLVLSHIIKNYELTNLNLDIMPIGRITLKPSKPVSIDFKLRD